MSTTEAPSEAAPDTAPGETSELTTRQFCWRVLRNDPTAFAISWCLWVTFHTVPVAVGWLVKLILDRLSEGSTTTPWLLLGTLAGVEVGRWLLFAGAAVQWHGSYMGWLSLPRVNALRSLVTGGGPAEGRLPHSPGEAVSRFRDDTRDIALVLDVWLDISGALVSATIAFVVVASIDPLAAVGVFLPVVVALSIALAFGPRLRRWRRSAREAGGAVTGFIGDTFGSVLAIKTAGAETAVTTRFAEHNAARAQVALRDQVGSEFVRSLGYGTGEIAVGVVLLFVASTIRSGELSAGDIALFASYVTVIAGLAKWAGRMASYHLQADVSTGRLARLTRRRSAAAVVTPAATHLRHGPPAFVPDAGPRSGGSSPSDNGVEVSSADPLERLTVRGLTKRYLPADRGISDVDLHVDAGELVVVTGPVGAGKSTLLRSVLGLAECDAGVVSWNGVPIEPAGRLVPQRVAYVPQVPRLFSEALADTILLGLSPEHLGLGLWHACLDDDVADMEEGIATVVGPRGVRLSGGQIQRAGAARAFVRRPQLLVVDDLSSALDVETEHRLWDRFRADRPPAALIVSHRPTVLDLADRVLTMRNGTLS